jgi:hypothetical protein
VYQFLTNLRNFLIFHLFFFSVNLGGWLVMEPFITPALYQKYTTAVDEWTLSTAMAADPASGGLNQLEDHYNTFIVRHSLILPALVFHLQIFFLARPSRISLKLPVQDLTGFVCPSLSGRSTLGQGSHSFPRFAGLMRSRRLHGRGNTVFAFSSTFIPLQGHRTGNLFVSRLNRRVHADMFYFLPQDTITAVKSELLIY